MTDAPIFLIAIIVVVVIVVLKRYRDRGRRPSRSMRGRVDVERDLLHACRGDRALAERLIAHELQGRDDISRTGAALLALAKLRDDQR